MRLRSATSPSIVAYAPADAAPVASDRAPIVCGTDFTEQAGQALEAAVALAKRLGEPLILAHAVDRDSRTTLPTELRESLCTYGRTQLQLELERLRAANVDAAEAFAVGKPDAALVEIAAARHACLLVLASHGRRVPGRWLLGSVAERTAESAPIPTLVVKAAAPFTGWLEGRHRLRIFVGADLSAPSEAALRWVAWLRKLGGCDVVASYLEPVAATAEPFDGYPSPVVAELFARTASVQARCFRQQVRSILGANRVRIRIEKGWGRSDAHLIQVARDEHADLIVVGTHQRHGLSRLGHHSVSRGVLHYAPMSIACVPASTPAEP